MRTLYRSSLIRTLSFPATAEWVLVESTASHTTLEASSAPCVFTIVFAS